MTSIKDIAWLAGLLEGEGSFLVRKNRGVKSSAIITVQMTDRDIIERVANLFKRPIYGPYTRKERPDKPVYSTMVQARDAARWMMTLYPLMGVRRQAKIREVLDFWKAQPNRTST